MIYGLGDKRVVVTGAGSGIGRAISLGLAREGAAVAVMGRTRGPLTELEIELRRSGAKEVLVIAGDVSSRADTERAAREAEGAFLGVDILVNSAGVTRPDWAVEMTEEDFDRVLATNLKGAFLCCQAFGRGMLDRGNGAIANIASVNAFGGQSGRVNYTASKAGLLGLTRTLAVEWGRHGVRVNAVAPQLIETPMIAHVAEPTFLDEVVKDRTPLGRLGRAEEVAAVTLFLVSDAASYVTGATILVDGGLSAGFLTTQQGANAGFRSGYAARDVAG